MRRLAVGICIWAALIAAPIGEAQTAARTRTGPPPVISGVFPPGAERGASTQWRISGRGLARVARLIGLGPGIDFVAFEPEGDTQARVTIRVSPDAPLGFRELRVEGPDGISNLALIRIDDVPQTVEQEPNDQPNSATPMNAPGAFVATLVSTDVDHVRIAAIPGTKLTLDLEARRLGTAFAPIVTVMTSTGASLAQARESPGGDLEPRLGVEVPRDGVVVVSIRDNLYGGAASAHYRLRVSKTPYASGQFPLGGPRGREIAVRLDGGTLAGPIEKRLTLPAASGPSFDLGSFPVPDGAIAAPMQFVVGEPDEMMEPDPRPQDRPPAIAVGRTMNGRLGRPDEIDRYRLPVKKGDKVRVEVQAASLGSWLDSVLTVRDGRAGNIVGQNDDNSPNGGVAAGGRRINAFGLVEGSQDSMLDLTATDDDEWVVEVADRFGGGGPEYPYRLSVGLDRPEFQVSLMLGNPNANAASQVAQPGAGRLVPGALGVFNLAPGTVTPVNFVVQATGAPGPVTIAAVGLPPGVHIEPVRVDLPRELRANTPKSRTSAGGMVIRVDPYADPAASYVEFVATSEPATGPALVRKARANIGVQLAGVGGRVTPITRTLDSFPLRVLGDLRERFVGPPPPPVLREIRTPGTLLQGDRLDLELVFEPSPAGDPEFDFEVDLDESGSKAGLAGQAVIAAGGSDSENDATLQIARILSSPTTPPGVYPVRISARFAGGRTIEARANVVVRRPLEPLVRAETLRIAPGGSAVLRVAVLREPGCIGEVEIRVGDVPAGVSISSPTTLSEGESEIVLRLEMAKDAPEIATERELSIVAVARMPRGAVATETVNRPRIVSARAEE